MCHTGLRRVKIQPQMAVSGSADIFSIKVDSRLKTILIHTGVATEMNFSSVFLQFWPPNTENRNNFDEKFCPISKNKKIK